MPSNLDIYYLGEDRDQTNNYIIRTIDGYSPELSAEIAEYLTRMSLEIISSVEENKPFNFSKLNRFKKVKERLNVVHKKEV